MRYKVISKQNNSNMCFVCGTNNDASLGAKFYSCLDECGEPVLITTIAPRDIHQSYPNRMHGGVISAVLDESIGRASQIGDPDLWSVTIELALKFRGVVPLDRTVFVESRITNITSRAIEGEGRVFCECKNGKPVVLVSAVGKYLRVKYDDVFPADTQIADVWYQVPEDLPEFIVVP